MNTERKPVDVLAVMLALIVEVDADENPKLNDAGIEARAAVAELFRMARVVDVYVSGEAPEDVREEWREALARCGVQS